MNEHQQKVYDTLRDMHVLERDRLLREGIENKSITEEDKEIVLAKLNEDNG